MGFILSVKTRDDAARPVSTSPPVVCDVTQTYKVLPVGVIHALECNSTASESTSTDCTLSKQVP